MLLVYRIHHSVSFRPSSKPFWKCWLQMMFAFWQKAKMNSVAVGSLNEFSHRHRHLATFASLRVQGTSTSCWTNGSRNTGTIGWKVLFCLFLKFNSENWLWKCQYLWSSLSFVYMKRDTNIKINDLHLKGSWCFLLQVSICWLLSVRKEFIWEPVTLPTWWRT